MEFGKLNYLEETMTSLAAYLIIADKRHPRQILGDSDNNTPAGEVRTSKIRVTQHYIAALLAYGVPPTAPELRRVTEWFSTPFPLTEHDDIDSIEMTKLEALLNLNPEDGTVKPRLKQLVEQRSEANGFFEIDREKGGTIFDTLWACKLILMARQKGVLDDLITVAEIQQSVDNILRLGAGDKDLALALRLRHELCGRLEPEHEVLLTQLLNQCKEYGHMWGISRKNTWNKVEQIITAMHKRQLSSTVIGDNEKDFRDVVLNSCYVIENLALLADKYPDVADALQRSVELWWRQFRGENAPVILRALFEDEYNYLMVICRTMVAISIYIGEPLGARFWLRPLREMSNKFSSDDWPERQSIEEALRRWIGIRLGDPTHLKLGLSEANVIRISPNIYNPTAESKDNLLRDESLIVKYGPIHEIESERFNYQQLSGRMRGYFVSIPEEESYINRERQAFVIIEDLRDYYTLFEIYDKLLKYKNPRLPGLLGTFLVNVHRGDNGQTRWSTNNHLRDIYIVKMLRHVDFIQNYVHHVYEHDLIFDEQAERFREIDRKLNYYIAGVMQHQEKIARFPLSIMHGDLHSRNIMIRILEPGRNWGVSDLDFKLIDLESLRMDGDAAHDAGQLFVDLELLPLTGKPNLKRSILVKLEDLRAEILTTYLEFAKERGDETFALRLDLAKSRALIRIAKAFSKRGEHYLKNLEEQQAVNRVVEAMHLAESAIIPLERVYEAICS